MYKPKTFADEILFLDFQVAQQAKLDALTRELDEYQSRIKNMQKQLGVLKSTFTTADDYGLCKGLISLDMSMLNEKLQDLSAARKITLWTRKNLRELLDRRNKKLQNHLTIENNQL